MISLPESLAIFQFFRANSASEARKVKSTFSRCSGIILWMKVASSPTASTCPSDSSSSKSRTSADGKLRSESTSLTSLPFSVAAPTTATRNAADPPSFLGTGDMLNPRPRWMR